MDGSQIMFAFVIFVIYDHKITRVVSVETSLDYHNVYANYTSYELLLKSYNISLSPQNRLKRQIPNQFSKPAQHQLDIFDPMRKGGLICKLCIVMDDQFASAYDMRDPTIATSEMKWIVDRASWILRNIDFNDDGTPENIGISMGKLSQGWAPYPYETEHQYLKAKPGMSLLSEFGRLQFDRSCCLGVGFTNRPLENMQVAVAFLASPKLLGGICDFRAAEFPLRSANVVLISGKGVRDTQLSKKDLSGVLIHELGHALGVVKHDRDLVEASPQCSGFNYDAMLPGNYKNDDVDPPEGRFIMWGEDIQGIESFKPNNLQFSPCSIHAVRTLLQHQKGRAACLVREETAFCGNGIVESSEECDCGNEETCKKAGCCGSRGSTGECEFFKGNPLNCPMMLTIKDKQEVVKKKTTSGATKLKTSSTVLIIFGLGYIFVLITSP